MADQSPTAAVLLIGDEILSGRTKDKNLGFIADYLTVLGIDLKEARVVPDIEDEIVQAVNALRRRYTYVFTTGGIGPTHDDITADAVAKAFDVEIDHHPQAVEILLAHFKQIGREPNEARLRMARTPKGATLIANPVSKAPGFSLGNVHVMAGVPSIMQAMLDVLAQKLPTGRKMMSRSLPAGMGEGKIATRLGEIQAAYPEVSVGSYPTFDPATGFTTTIVVRSRDEEKLTGAETAVAKMIRELHAGGKPPD